MARKEIQERIRQRIRRHNKPFSADALLSALHLKKAERASALLVLAKMERTGELIRNKKGKYEPAGGTGAVRGRMLSLNKRFGFARLEEKRADCFIARQDLRNALPGDVVSIRLGPPDSRGLQGEVLQVVEPGPHRYTGCLREDKRKGWMIEPDAGFRYSLPVRSSALGGAVPGDKVRFSVKQRKEGDWLAAVETVYGSADSARVCADAIVDSRGIPTVFPDNVLEQAQRLRDLRLPEEWTAQREDLRDWTIFTIDGEDAKDLDDAVSLEELSGGWRLGVHIADVSHYVRAGSSIDEEARRRGTSVYFADRVIPMLPEALSNGACSLNAQEDKLALSAVLTLDKQGNCRDVRLVKSVIRSKVRGVYSEVNALLAGRADAEITAKYAPVSETLARMRRLAARLREAAEERGTMDLFCVESRFLLDEEGRPAAVMPRVAGEAEGIIEQFMIAANVAVASLARLRKLPFVYRIHEAPNVEKLAALLETARLFGLKAPLQSEDLPAAALRDLLEQARDTPYARLISEQLLRAMAKAVYSDNPLGHYGLALRDYCHFTSPIRRYPDLVIHRILSEYLEHTPLHALYDRYGDFVRAAAEESTACEIRAMRAERDCEACYKAEYMLAYLGEAFTGLIVSVSDVGLFVELENTVCGLLPIEELPEMALHFDGAASLTDERGKRCYTVGQPIRVQAASCQVPLGRVNFVPMPQTAEETEGEID